MRDDFVFTSQEYAARLAAVRERMAAERLDGLIAYSTSKVQANVRYLSDYFVRFSGMQNRKDGSYYMFGSAVCLVDAGDEAPIVRTDQPWDVERCKAISIFPDADGSDDLAASIGPVIAKRGYRRVGIDNWYLFPAWVLLGLQRLAPGVEFVPTHLMSEVRRRKSPAEIARIREACRVGSIAVTEGFEAITVGGSEFEVQAICEYGMRRRGDINTSGESIGGCGPNTASGSHLPSRFNDRPMRSGEWVMLDINPRVEGYTGDVSRHWVVGDPADLDPELLRLYETCLRVNQEVRAAIRPGVTGRELSALADRVTEEGGFAGRRIELLGHGLGIDIHDIPDYFYDDSPWSAGEVITVEPCLLLPGKAGIRIEDTVLVTEDGCEVLTPAPYGMWA